MKGILLISHGDMAKGMADSAKLFFGDEISQMKYLCLKEGESPDEFRTALAQQIQDVDTGDGVVILADLYGGTPCNQAIPLLTEKVDLIPGMNLGILVKLLSEREFMDPDIATLIESGQNCIVNVKEMLGMEQKNDFF